MRIKIISSMAEASSWDPSSPEFSRQEHRMFYCMGCIVIPTMPAKQWFFINSVTSYAYDNADVMDNDNFTTMLESFVIILSLLVAQVNTNKIPVHYHLDLAKKWDISTKKCLIQFVITHSMVSAQCCKHYYHDRTGQMIINLGTEDYHIMCTMIHGLPTQCLEEAISVHRFLQLILVGHAHLKRS